MARKKSDPNSNSGTGHRFLDVPLSQSDKEDLRQYDLEVEFPWGDIEQLVSEGYKYSLSRDPRNQSYISALTDRLEGSPHNNTTLSGRGSTPTTSRASLLYRHLVIADGDWSRFVLVSNQDAPDFD